MKTVSVIFSMIFGAVVTAGAQSSDSIMVEDGMQAHHPNVVVASAETAGANAIIHSLCRILDKPYTKTTLPTLRKNFHSGFKWDNDDFVLNNLGHPYQGNLYYNAARSQGFSFWQSAPFTTVGSLMWEYLGEREPPAINDVVITTASGICLGEVAHRLAKTVRREDVKGFPRFLRETAATIIDPVGGFNRLLSGEATRVRSCQTVADGVGDIPLDLSLTVGHRLLTDGTHLSRGRHSAGLALAVEYGEATEPSSSPYNYFSGYVLVLAGGHQPVLARAEILGRLWGKTLPVCGGEQLLWGFWQYFNYYDYHSPDTYVSPFPCGEMASFGPGIVSDIPFATGRFSFHSGLYAGGVILGGVRSDYYSFGKRKYNMGSGYSLKGRFRLDAHQIGRLSFDIGCMRLFTWKGYEDNKLSDTDVASLNVQGDKSHACVLSANMTAAFCIWHDCHLTLSAVHYRRITHYSCHPTQKAASLELSSGLAFWF